MSAHTPPAREPLSSVDFAWLRMDDPTNLMHINGVLVLDQPVAFESIRDIIAQRLLAIPRFRNRVVVPKSGKPYGLIALAVVLVVGFALTPVWTGIALAYGYLLAPLLLPVVSPLARLVPDRVKESLS